MVNVMGMLPEMVTLGCLPQALPKWMVPAHGWQSWSQGWWWEIHLVEARGFYLLSLGCCHWRKGREGERKKEKKKERKRIIWARPRRSWANQHRPLVSTACLLHRPVMRWGTWSLYKLLTSIFAESLAAQHTAAGLLGSRLPNKLPLH